MKGIILDVVMAPQLKYWI